MNYLKKFLWLLIFLYIKDSSAFSIKVSLFNESKVKSLVISPNFGEYRLLVNDSIFIQDIAENTALSFNIDKNLVVLSVKEKVVGSFAKVKIEAKEYPSSLKVKTSTNNSKVKSFDETIEVSSNGEKLNIINLIDLEHYIAGVVECESGVNETKEYYKLQAILCRTYALSNLRRHEAEGFNLCDRVHCQAYYKKSSLPIILNAVIETKGLVIVDNDLNLITAAFHSNCGGKTVNSEDVWSLPTSYLKSIKDTFCLNQTHAKWQRIIPKEDWNSYLNLKCFNKELLDSSAVNTDLFNTNQKRDIFYTYKNVKIPLKTIRADWQLKSTLFSVETQNDTILLKGKGYGHGIGLCQEGAMKMTKMNFSYTDIIHFYYTNVHIIDLSMLHFFKEN